MFVSLAHLIDVSYVDQCIVFVLSRTW